MANSSITIMHRQHFKNDFQNTFDYPNIKYIYTVKILKFKTFIYDQNIDNWVKS